MKSKHIILYLLVPLSEIKAIYYESPLKVSWYIFSENKRFMCNVLEDYSNILIMGVVFYYYLFVNRDKKTNEIILFLGIFNALDLLFLGLFDNEYYMLKIPLSLITYFYANTKVSFQRN